MNAGPSRHLWTSISTSGALHLAAVAGLLAAGGATNGWMPDAYLPPPGYSAPQLTLRIPSESARQEKTLEILTPRDLAAQPPVEIAPSEQDAAEVGSPRTLADPHSAAERSLVRDELQEAADPERRLMVDQSMQRASFSSAQSSIEMPAADSRSSGDSPRRKPTEARIATRSGPTVDPQTDVRAGARNAANGSASADSAASQPSERQTGVAAAIPEKIFSPQPDYPADELAAGHEGRVVLRVRVNARGSVESADVKQSSGFPALDEAARVAVRRWRFKIPDADSLQPDQVREVAIPIRFEIQR